MPLDPIAPTSTARRTAPRFRPTQWGFRIFGPEWPEFPVHLEPPPPPDEERQEAEEHRSDSAGAPTFLDYLQ